MNRIRVPFNVKSIDAKGTIEGYGSTFGNVDYGNDVCVKGCFKKSLAELKSKGQMPAMLFNHSSDEPIGDWLEASEDDHGLLLKGVIWIGKGIPKAEQAYMMCNGTGSKGLSIGYLTKRKDIDPKSGVRRLLETDLLETSIVPFPMNPEAGVTSVKNLARDEKGNIFDPRTFEHLLRDELGLTAKEAKALMSQGYSALKGVERDADPSQELKAIAEQINNNIKALKG